VTGIRRAAAGIYRRYHSSKRLGSADGDPQGEQHLDLAVCVLPTGRMVSVGSACLKPANSFVLPVLIPKPVQPGINCVSGSLGSWFSRFDTKL
jgi:hypothetical protein